MDYINWNPNALDEGSVFAFQAPVDGHCKDVASVVYDPHSLGSHKRHTVVAVIR